MLRSRARVNRGDDRDLRRHSTFIPRDTSNENNPLFLNDRDTSDLQTCGRRTVQASSRVRDSVDSFGGVREGPVKARSPSPPVEGGPAKHHRFSILRFRHASDSQLAKTAKEHANVPPVPSCK